MLGRPTLFEHQTCEEALLPNASHSEAMAPPIVDTNCFEIS